jgi:hypothetical protein
LHKSLDFWGGFALIGCKHSTPEGIGWKTHFLRATNECSDGIKPEEGNMASFQNRIIRAAKLDVNLYEEVEADKGAMGQAMGIVILSSVAAGVGTISRGGFGGILMGTLSALIGWYVWAYVTYLIGTKLLPVPETRADPGQLLRTIGFSSSPGLIRLVGIIPGLTGLVFFVASIWMLVAMVIAVRQALDYKSTWRAVGVCAIGWIIQSLILVLLFWILGIPKSL